MPPVVSIVGKSKSGKTTLIENLVRELKSRGYSVATIKHAPQGMTWDESDKDNWRHIKAGSEATAIASPDKIVLIKTVAQDVALDEVVYLFDEDYDIILAEGYKEGSAPKIEVHRKGIGSPLSGLTKLMAIVTDEPLETKARQFSWQDVKGLADLIEEGFIKPQRERTSVYVNHAPLALSTFPRDIITNTLLAMVSSLKGVGKIRSIRIFLKRETEQE